MRAESTFYEKFWDVIGMLLQTPCREKSKKAQDSADKAKVAAENTKLICKNISNGSKPRKHL